MTTVRAFFRFMKVPAIVLLALVFWISGAGNPQRWWFSIDSKPTLVQRTELGFGVSEAGAQTKPNFDERAVAEFYRDKTIRLVIGFTPGGGFDVVGRIAARSLGKYVPGNPKVIVVNRPGAGSLVAANEVYNVLPQDGTVIGLTSERLIIRQALKEAPVRFDARRMQWLASVSSSPITCVVHRGLGVKNIHDALTGREIHMGGTGGSSSQAPLLLNRVLGTKFNVIHGYAGVAQVRVSVESREVDGLCISWDGLKTLAPEWFQERWLVSVLSTMGPSVPAAGPLSLREAPRVEELVKGDLEKKLLTAYGRPDEAAMPFYFGPKVPQDKVAAVRAAFTKLFADQEVLSSIEKAGRTPAPRTGGEVAKIYAGVLEITPEVAAELSKIIAF